MKLNTIILISLLLLSGVASAEFDGYTQYNYNNIYGNNTINFGDYINVSTAKITTTTIYETYDYLITTNDTTTDDLWLKLSMPGNSERILKLNKTGSYSPNGSAVFLQYHGPATSSFLDSNDITPENVIYEGYGRRTTSANLWWGMGTTLADNPGDGAYLKFVDDTAYSITYNNTASDVHITPSWDTTLNKWYNFKLLFNETAITAYYDDVQFMTPHTTVLPDDDLGLGMYLISGSGEQKYSFVRKYVQNDPVVSVYDMGSYYEIHINSQDLLDEYQVSIPCSELNITSETESLEITEGYQSSTINTSVIGDSDNRVYTNGTEEIFYLYPTENITNISYITDQYTAYNTTARIYWTENTAIITEVVNNSHAVLNIDYTPADNITVGYFNTVFNTVDLTQFTGSTTCTINGTPTTCDLTGNSVNIALNNLNAGQLYYINVSVPYNEAPVLLSPANESSDDYTFPPLQHDITLNWNSTYADTYKYEVATDAGFNFIFATDEIAANTTDVTLNVPDTYYWRIYGNYNGTYSPASDVWSFTMNATSTATGTGVNGVVYDASNNPVTSATVNIYNNTWSDSVLSTSSGYFQFTGLTGGETYYLQASKDGYSTSPTATATVTTDEIYTVNILIQKVDAPNYILPHNVEFVVRSIDDKYKDVFVNVYEGDSATVLDSQYTGTDGSVGFELSETTQYRITFYKDGVIDREVTVTPTAKSYTVWVDLAELIESIFDDSDQELTNIDIEVTTSTINDSAAYVNVSYYDSLDETSGLNISLQQQIENQPGNYTTIDSYLGGSNNDVDKSFIVTNYDGESYIVSVTGTHTTHGGIDKLFGVTFPTTQTEYGLSVQFLAWIAIMFIVWIASTASQQDVYQTGLLVSGIAGFFKLIDIVGSIISWPAIALSFVVCIVGIMYLGEKEAV